MPDVRTWFDDKKWIYAYDLQGRDITLTIAKAIPGEVMGDGGRKNKKPVLYFQGKQKGLVLNITNVRTIGALYGFEAKEWIGKRITIYPTTCQFGPNTVECIRVRPRIPGDKQKDAPPDPPPADERVPGADDGEEGAAA
jgi:hypothetical protein